MPRLTAAAWVRMQIRSGRTDEQIVADARICFPEMADPARAFAGYLSERRRGVVGRYLGGHRSPSALDAQPADVSSPDGLSERAFGIEFEFLRGGRTLSAWAEVLRPVLGDKLQVIDGYEHSDGRKWDLKKDSSCGYELATPRLTRADWPLVEQVLAALQAAGARVSRSCGLHVHHEVRDYTRSALVALVRAWGTFGEVIGEVLPESRRRNSFCRRLPLSSAGWTYDEIRAAFGDYGDRYQAINVIPYWTAGRIEVRQHNGTLNARKTLAWLVMTQRMVEAATRASAAEFTVAGASTLNAPQQSMRERFAALVRWARVPARVASSFSRRLAA